MAAQWKMPEAGAPSAYGGIVEAGRLVVLAKPMPSGAGYYQPFAVVRFEDLPEELRRQIAGASGHGAGEAVRPRDPNAAPVAAAAAPCVAKETRGTTPRALPVDVVPEVGLRRQLLPGLVTSGPNDSDNPNIKFAGDGSSDAVMDYSERRRRILRLIDKDGKAVVRLDASRLQMLGDMEGGSLFQTEKGFSHAWMGHNGDEEWIPGSMYKVVVNDNSEPSNMASTQRAAHAYMGAFYDNGLPAREDAAPVVVALLPGNNLVVGPRSLDCSRSDDLASPRQEQDAVAFVDTQPLLGDGRTTEQGDVLVPPAGEALRAPHSPTYAVQVSVDPAAGGKAGDPIAGGVKVKAGDADAGHEHGSVSAVLGIVVASSAATALAAGTVGPATAFALFAALVGGVSLAMASVRTM